MRTRSSGSSLRRGSRGDRVRVLQEWLCLHDFLVVVDGIFGPATELAVRRFQAGAGLPPSGVVDRPTSAKLLAPMERALAPIDPAPRGLGRCTVAYARQHLEEHPREVGGQNRGPWVRLYMGGNEGTAWPWCAGFACHVLKQACNTLGMALPILPSFSCDSLAASAKEKGLFVPEAEVRAGRRVPAGSLFLTRRTATDWIHTGIIVRSLDETFESIEGNTNDEGSREGHEVCRRIRGYLKQDFIVFAG